MYANAPVATRKAPGYQYRHPSTLTEQDIDAIAERVHNYSVPTENAPKTVEARIVSFGMDKLPHEDRERLLAMVRAMYPGLFEEKKGE